MGAGEGSEKLELGLGMIVCRERVVRDHIGRDDAYTFP